MAGRLAVCLCGMVSTVGSVGDEFWSARRLRLELPFCAAKLSVVALRSRARQYASSSGRASSKILVTTGFSRRQVAGWERQIFRS
jgi:hypothetical protein